MKITSTSKIIFPLSFFFGLLLTWGSSITPPDLLNEFVSDYQLGYFTKVGGSVETIPLFRGKYALNLKGDGCAFIQVENDGDAPFLLQTAFGFQKTGAFEEAGDGRCFLLGSVVGGFIITELKLNWLIYKNAEYLGTGIVLGQNCSLWMYPWDFDGNNATVAVRISDSAWISLTTPWFYLNFTNIEPGNVDDSWCTAPLIPCLSSKYDSIWMHSLKLVLNLLTEGTTIEEFFQNLKPVIHERKPEDPPIPDLVQIFSTDYVFGDAVENEYISLFTGHVGMDYKNRNLRVVFQESQESRTPFIISTTSLSHSNQTNSSDILAYQFLGRGSCWQAPLGMFDFILDYQFAIPSNATFDGNTTINNITCQIWKWSYTSPVGEITQRVIVDPKTGIFYQFEIIFAYEKEITWIWKNSNFQANYNPPNFYKPPPGCRTWQNTDS